MSAPENKLPGSARPSRASSPAVVALFVGLSTGHLFIAALKFLGVDSVPENGWATATWILICAGSGAATFAVLKRSFAARAAAAGIEEQMERDLLHRRRWSPTAKWALLLFLTAIPAIFYLATVFG